MRSSHQFKIIFTFLLLISNITLSLCEKDQKEKSETTKPSKKENISERYQIEDDVIVLSPTNFFKALKEFDLMMIEFYSPNCGHCKKLAPEYTAISKHFEKDEVVQLAKINCSKYKKFTDQFEVSHYPTLHVFYKGVQVIEYHTNFGEKNKKNIIPFLEQVKQVLAYPIESMESVEIIQKLFISGIVYFGDNESDLKLLEGYPFKMMKNVCNNKEIMEKLNVKPRTLVLFKEFDEKRNDLVIEKDLTFELIEEFLDNYSKPLLHILKYDIFLGIFAIDIPALVLYENSDDVKECERYENILREAAKIVKKKANEKNTTPEMKKKIEELVFTKMNGKVKGLEADAFKEEKFPKNQKFPLLKLHNNKKKQVFKFDEEFTAEEISKFAISFLKGQLIPIEFGDL